MFTMQEPAKGRLVVAWTLLAVVASAARVEAAHAPGISQERQITHAVNHEDSIDARPSALVADSVAAADAKDANHDDQVGRQARSVVFDDNNWPVVTPPVTERMSPAPVELLRQYIVGLITEMRVHPNAHETIGKAELIDELKMRRGKAAKVRVEGLTTMEPASEVDFSLERNTIMANLKVKKLGIKADYEYTPFPGIWVKGGINAFVNDMSFKIKIKFKNCGSTLQYLKVEPLGRMNVDSVTGAGVFSLATRMTMLRHLDDNKEQIRQAIETRLTEAFDAELDRTVLGGKLDEVFHHDDYLPHTEH